MSHRLHASAMLAAAVILPVMIGGCSASPAAAPAPTGSADPASDRSTPGEDARAPEDLSFDAGAALPAGTEINMGESLGADPGWTELPPEGPGRWAYQNADGTCTASYRQGPISDTGGMDDADASDAALASATGWTTADLAPLLVDGAFVRHGEGDARIAHRQASVRIVDGGVLSGSLVAARAFVAVQYSVEVTVTCGGADIDVVAGEVLGKTLVQVIEP